MITQVTFVPVLYFVKIILFFCELLTVIII